MVVDKKDVDTFLSYAAEENLEAVAVAVVTEEPRLVMEWRGKTIVDISRAFLDTNGAHQEASVILEIPGKEGNPFADRCWFCVYALWGQIPAYRNSDYGGQASCPKGKDRYCHYDELWI